MKRVLIDTNIYSCAMRGKNFAVEIMQTTPNILMSPVVMGELYSGFKYGKHEKRNKEQLRSFISSPRVELLQISDNTAEFYAHILTLLRKKGAPVPTNDIWIAASALENGAELASLDSHFLKIDGLLLTTIRK